LSSSVCSLSVYLFACLSAGTQIYIYIYIYIYIGISIYI
jgi:hypothetical protein